MTALTLCCGQKMVKSRYARGKRQFSKDEKLRRLKQLIKYITSFCFISSVPVKPGNKCCFSRETKSCYSLGLRCAFLPWNMQNYFHFKKFLNGNDVSFPKRDFSWCDYYKKILSSNAKFTVERIIILMTRLCCSWDSCLNLVPLSCVYAWSVRKQILYRQ